jgi:inner membrane protein
LPTVITHSAVAISSGIVFGARKIPLKFWILSIICSVLPDADVIGYHYFFIPYDHFLGHRGFFHSPFFAAIVGITTVSLFFRDEKAFTMGWWKLVLYFSILTASHGLLDALTNGGRGIALLSPFTNERYFFPWNPLEVSPLSVKAFISARGLTVLKSEMIWVWAPSAFIVLLLWTIRIAWPRR